MATSPRLAIVGTGRSGSGHISAVLTAAGVPCGHEGWWNPQGLRTPGLLADSSWCAAAYLPRFGGSVAHQVRHPLEVISSLAALPDHGAYLLCRLRLIGRSRGGALGMAVHTYVEWNAICERWASARWQVETLTPETVISLGRVVGVSVTEETAHAALQATPRDFNDHGPRSTLTWADLSHLPEYEKLLGMAGRYGYEIPSTISGIEVRSGVDF